MWFYVKPCVMDWILGCSCLLPPPPPEPPTLLVLDVVAAAAAVAAMHSWGHVGNNSVVKAP